MPPRPPKMWVPLLAAVLLFALVFALFAPSIRYALVDIDDPVYITGNRMVLSGLTADSVAEAFRSFTYASMYMPLLWVSYMADISLFGASPSNPAPFHAVNVALHAANAVLFFFLLLRLLPRPSSNAPSSTSSILSPICFLLLPFLLSLIWAMHPLRVESVAWVTERKDVLSLFFALLSLLFYLLPERVGGAGAKCPSLCRCYRVLALLAFAASLLVKPALVPYPLLLVLLDILVFHHPLSLRLFLSKTHYFLLSAAATATAMLGHSHSMDALPFPLRLAHLPQNLVYYLRATLLPRHLTLLEPDPAYAILPALLATFILATLLLLAIRLHRSRPIATLGILWFFLFLLPVSGLVAIPNAAVVDRFSYVPALGLSVALLSLFPHLGGSGAKPPSLSRRSSAMRAAPFLLLCTVLAAEAAITARLLPHWRSSSALFDRVRRFNTHHFLVLHDVRRDIAAGDYASARAHSLDYLRRDPSCRHLHGPFASCIANTDGPLPALDFLLPLRPPPGPFLGEWAWQMAHLSLRAGRPADALSFADLADSALPPQNTLHANIARLRAAASSPDPSAALPHAISQWMSYERADALEIFRRLVAANPGRPDILANIAWILSTASWSPAPPSEALDYATRALALAGDRPPPELLDTCAAALANASDFPAAVAAQKQALSLLPPASPSLPDYQSRLDLYRHDTPYRHDIGIPW